MTGTTQQFSEEDASQRASKADIIFDKDKNLVTGISPQNSFLRKKKEKKYELSLTEENLGKLDFIVDLVSKGKTKSEIVSVLKNKYNFKFTTCLNYYWSALRYWKNIQAEEKNFLRQKYELMLMNLFNAAVQEGDRKEAHNLMKTLMKLNSVSDKEKENIQTKFVFKFNTTVENIQKPKKIDDYQINFDDDDVQDINFEEEDDGE